MRLFRLTFATILQRKAWAICAFAVTALPFALPMISSATEKPLLMQPARILAQAEEERFDGANLPATKPLQASSIESI